MVLLRGDRIKNSILMLIYTQPNIYEMEEIFLIYIKGRIPEKKYERIKEGMDELIWDWKELK